MAAWAISTLLILLCYSSLISATPIVTDIDHDDVYGADFDGNTVRSMTGSNNVTHQPGSESVEMEKRWFSVKAVGIPDDQSVPWPTIASLGWPDCSASR